MKRASLCSAFVFYLISTAFCQIEVGANNNIAIGISGLVNSKFAVNHVGSSAYGGYVYNPSLMTGGGLIGVKTSGSAGTWSYGINGTTILGTGYSVGVVGSAKSSTPLTTGMSFGVIGYAGNATAGYNYGIYGELDGTNNGAAVFGSTTGVTNVNGIYAGYFLGKVKVQGELWTTSGTITGSDERNKKEIKELDKNNLAKIKKVNAVKYKYKSPIELGIMTKEVVDTLSTVVLKEMEIYYNEEHIGFLAQEIQAVYPELVKTDQSGNLGVDYNGLIPVLLEAIKEQQTAIEALALEVEKLKGKKVKE